MFTDILRRLHVIAHAALAGARQRAGREHGEGVVSMAIAVLVMAFLGALMWLGFKEIWLDAQEATREQVGEIGR